MKHKIINALVLAMFVGVAVCLCGAAFASVPYVENAVSASLVKDMRVELAGTPMEGAKDQDGNALHNIIYNGHVYMPVETITEFTHLTAHYDNKENLLSFDRAYGETIKIGDTPVSLPAASPATIIMANTLPEAVTKDSSFFDEESASIYALNSYTTYNELRFLIGEGRSEFQLFLLNPDDEKTLSIVLLDQDTDQALKKLRIEPGKHVNIALPTENVEAVILSCAYLPDDVEELKEKAEECTVRLDQLNEQLKRAEVGSANETYLKSQIAKYSHRLLLVNDKITALTSKTNGAAK